MISMNPLLQKSNPASKQDMLHIKAKPVVQAKLTVNTPGDMYEQEADAMADRVMRMSSNETAKPVTGLIGKSLQRKCAHCAEEEKRKKPVMRKAEAGNSGMSVSSSFASSLNASKGGGSPLPQGTRSFMENAFSVDFSSVRVHADSKASEMNRGINAKAFTHGNDVYFGEGQYAPDTYSGKNLLAHELTHVVQQEGNAIRQLVQLQRFCPEPTAHVNDTVVQTHINAALVAGTIGRNIDLESAWRHLRLLRENHCCDVNLAAAEHYMYARMLVANGDFSFAVMILIIGYDLLKLTHLAPRTGDCPITRASLSAISWATSGAVDGESDYYGSPPTP
jgi:hypothetical protein